MARFSPNEKEKISNRLDTVSKRLYSKDPHAISGHREGVLHPSAPEIKTTWSDTPSSPQLLQRFKLPASVFKKFFIGAIVFFLLATGYALYSFFGGGNSVSNQNIEIAVLGNTFTAGGEDLPLSVEITNKNTVGLEFADLIISYPKGTGASATGLADKATVRYSLGTISSGKTATKDITVVLFGSEGSTADVSFTLEYRLAGSNAIFEKNKIYTVTLNAAPIAITIDAPEEVNSNQKITLSITTTANAKKTVEDLMLKVDYPPGFQFESATPAPTSFQNIWNLGDLAPGSEHTIKVVGTIFGQDGEERTFHISAGAAKAGDASVVGVIYNASSYIVSIVKPFIEAKILVNGLDAEENFIDADRTVLTQIAWANNLPTRITDVVITASFSGDALDEATLDTNSGFYDSNSNTIVWDKTTLGTLGAIEPGEHGTVDFSFASLPLFSQSGVLLKDPTINIAVSIKGKEPSLGADVKEITNIAEKTIKINSDFELGAEATYSTGPFANTGPMPPQAGSPTTYTITWTLANSANNIINAEARSTLPTYVSWVGTSTPASENITFDASSKSILWKIGSVSGGTGYTGGTRSVSFQVILLPSVSQVGSIPQLILETKLTGTDSFTQQSLDSTHPALNTHLTNDPMYSKADRVVN